MIKPKNKLVNVLKRETSTTFPTSLRAVVSTDETWGWAMLQKTEFGLAGPRRHTRESFHPSHV